MIIATILEALRPGPRAIVQAHETIRRRHARASCGFGYDRTCDMGTRCADCPDAPKAEGRE